MDWAARGTIKVRHESIRYGTVQAHFDRHVARHDTHAGWTGLG